MTARAKLISNITGQRPGHEPGITNKISTSVSEINDLHESILIDLGNAVKSAIMIGGKLAAEKEKVGHGNWLPWIESNLNFSISTATRYMKLWEHREIVNSSSMTNLESALKLISGSTREEKDITPVRNASDIYKDYHAGGTISKKEKEILREWISEQVKNLETKAKKFKSELNNL